MPRLFCLLLWGGLSVAQAQMSLKEETWSSYFFQGKHAGYQHSLIWQRPTPQGLQWVSQVSELMTLKRLGTDLTIQSASQVVEDENGVVMSFSTLSSGSGMNVQSRGYRVGDEIVVFANGHERRYPVPKSTLGPAAADRQTRAMPLTAGSILRQTVFVPESPETAVSLDSTVVGPEKKSVAEHEELLWKIEAHLSVLPGTPLFLWVNHESETRVSTLPIPGLGIFECVKSSREEALKPSEGAEAFIQTMVAPSRALDLGKMKKVTYRMTFADATPASLVSGPEQQIVGSQPGSVDVTVSVLPLPAESIGWKLPYTGANQVDLVPYLTPSAYIDSDAPAVQKLAREAVCTETNPVLAAHAIETFVQRYIRNKDLNVAFATASETVRSREGDCTEHAVLCAALGRAVGLPTRVVTGLGYLEPRFATDPQDTGHFGFHMWAEAWVGPDQWVPMDAALNGFNVGHIAITKSALNGSDPSLTMAAPLLQLIAKLKIDVLATK